MKLFPTVCTLLFFITNLHAQTKPSESTRSVSNTIANQPEQAVTLSGFIKEKGSLETLPSASVYIPSMHKGTVANNYGFFSITIPAGTYEIEFSFVGFTKVVQKMVLTQSKQIDIELEASNSLQEVVVKGSKESQKISERMQMSSDIIPVDQIKDIPALLGEKDVFKVLQLLPGVQKGSEGSSGFYVRGGTPDQNLIILDDAVVYNANHLFGFFSIFNGDAIKSVELIKGGFPARFGERLSSVTVLNMKDGNKEKFHGEVGIGLLASRLTLEGPIKKGKSSFLVSGRRTYIDLFIPAKKEDGKENSFGLYFYDFNAKYNAYINAKNKLYISGYFGRDVLYAKNTDTNPTQVTDFSFGWGNATFTARWNHIFGSKVFSNTSLIYSSYDLKIALESKKPNSSMGASYNSSITDIGGKFDIDYSLANNHFIRTGIRFVTHIFKPYVLSYNGDNKNENVEQIYNSWENNLYIEDEWKVNRKLSLNVGLRASGFTTEGVSYWNLEPRLSSNYALGNDLAFKASYARMNQYIHLLSSTGIGLPTDLWVPSTKSVLPQRSDQIALGLAKDVMDRNLTISLEGYYKNMNNIISYLPGATFFNIPTNKDNKATNNQINSWESNVTSGQGKSYGAELLIQRKEGKFSGWLSYTLSWIKYKFNEINTGQEFRPLQDRRHDISLVGIYKISPKVKLSFTWVYTSGAPAQVALAQYNIVTEGPISAYGSSNQNTINGVTGTDYGAKGSYTKAAYHRLDVGAQFIKKKNRGERVWEIGVYNLYNRNNPFAYLTKSNNNNNISQTNKTLIQYSLFALIPSITYTRKF